MVTVYQLTLKHTGYIYIKIQAILHYHPRQSVCSFLHLKFSPFFTVIPDNLSVLLYIKNQPILHYHSRQSVSLFLHNNSAHSLLSFQTICLFFLHKKFSSFLIIIPDNLSVRFYIKIQPILYYHSRQSLCLLNVLFHVSIYKNCLAAAISSLASTLSYLTLKNENDLGWSAYCCRHCVY